MDKKRKNIIIIVALLVVTNLITHYASSGTTSILGEKNTVVVASVKGHEFSSNDIYTTWVESKQSADPLSALLQSIDEYILNDKYADDKTIADEVATQVEQSYAYYQSKGQDLKALLEQAGMSEEDWEKQVRDGVLLDKATKSYVESIVTKEQVEAAYNADAPKSRTSQILFKVEVEEGVAVTETEAAAKSKADEVYAELVTAMETSTDKNATFAQFAKDYSEDVNSKDIGGDIGFSNSESTEYQTEVDALNVGEFSEVIKTSYGYVIILKTEVQEKQDLSNESVYNDYKAQVAEKMIKSNDYYSKIALIELRSEYGLKFLDTSLGESYSLLVEQTNGEFEEAQEKLEGQ